ncbi:SMI1/KNR4 family protein [Epilithonimonas zeae]|uniref:SMI1/KNR4 family protein n=1 Tax=Epilithonimonas zeae TaxID=1416779 RepID=UPI0020101EC7|nr:SMI1/KNR4 family protein [Epilithonimonas zeae]UQB69986.1 SMI1/KNR4 family protein [Epilithonimonas zeae]
MPFPIDLKYIEETEKELGLTFPDSFKNKMRKENGGALSTKEDDWQLFPFFDQADQKRISRTSNHIVLETKLARNWGNFPVDGIAIASNGSADYLILLTTKENDKLLDDKIFSWLHETGEVKEIAKSIEEITSITLKAKSKKQVQKQKLNSLKTDDGFGIDSIPSPWILTEKFSHNKPPFYTFQIGKGTDCLVSLETAFPTDILNTDKYWFDQWKKETGLKPNKNDLFIQRNDLEDYSYIIVRGKNSTPVYYWINSKQTEKWHLKMKTSSSRHNGDFKELSKLLSNIRVEN